MPRQTVRLTTVFLAAMAETLGADSTTRPAALIARALRALEPVRRPSFEHPVSTFVVPLDAQERPYRPAAVFVHGVEECVRTHVLTVILSSDLPLPGAYERHQWLYGEREPEIIATLGLEVLE